MQVKQLLSQLVRQPQATLGPTLLLLILVMSMMRFWSSPFLVVRMVMQQLLMFTPQKLVFLAQMLLSPMRAQLQQLNLSLSFLVVTKVNKVILRRSM